MKRTKAGLIIILTLLLLVCVSCEHNVYLDGMDIWSIQDMQFGTFSQAMSYLLDHLDFSADRDISRDLVESDVPWERTIYLLKDVPEWVRGEAIMVPAEFTGELCINFNGHEYWFDPGIDNFLDIRGGDRVDIINGTTVITEDTASRTAALSVDVRVVTVDDHLIDDRRRDPVAVEVGPNGTLQLTSSSKNRTDIMIGGSFHIEGGGILEITEGCIYIADINDINAEFPGSFEIDACKVINPHSIGAIVEAAIPPEYADDVEVVFVHTWEKKWETLIRPSTCHEEGEVCVHYECTECDAHYDEFYYLPKLDHEKVWSNDKYYHWSECALCGDILDPKETHTFITIGGITYCVVCGYVQEEGGGVQSGFDVTVEDLIPAGYLTASDMDPETYLYTITFTSTNPDSEPEHYMWFIDDNQVEGATGTSIQAEYCYESFNVMCIFWNEKGTGSASLTIQ